MSRVDLPALAAASPMHGKGADRFQYELTIEDAGARHELAMSEDSVPDELRPLIERLNRRGSDA